MDKQTKLREYALNKNYMVIMVIILILTPAIFFSLINTKKYNIQLCLNIKHINVVLYYLMVHKLLKVL